MVNLIKIKKLNYILFCQVITVIAFSFFSLPKIYLIQNAQAANDAQPTNLNRLKGEKSPYLLQHADNPVHWYPWGDEAFKAAKNQNKPIFLSIGYSTCHWCHVMEKESFENEEVAAFLNSNFICIKVDREELPDVDQIYMEVVQAMTGSGGWPMTAILAPSKIPFFGGTYFPKDELLDVLQTLDTAWKEQPERIALIGQQVRNFLESRNKLSINSIDLDESVFRIAYKKFLALYDDHYFGFGTAPKFPPTMKLSLLSRIALRTKDSTSKEIVLNTLKAMAKGGIYDHLGGGFHRYSTDRKWLVPHFEKMLYDQAALSRAYLEGFQITKDAFFEQVARGILDYVLRNMTHSNGRFYSAEDADTEGEEGKFYVWTEAEVKQILKPNEWKAFKKFYGLSHGDNPELIEKKQTVIHMVKIPKNQLPTKAILEKLSLHRSKRSKPFKDDKTITAWNGLMIGSFAKAYQTLNDKKYLTAAQKSALFVKEKLDKNGKLLRRYREGSAEHTATLDDYAYLIAGLIDLYESDFNSEWIQWALNLQKRQDDYLWDEEEDGGYYFAEENAHSLPVRKKEFMDNARPNSNGISALNLLRLHNITLDSTYKYKAKKIFKAIGERLIKFPQAYSQTLIAFDFLNDNSKQIAIIGSPKMADPILKALKSEFLPNKILAYREPNKPTSLPILKDKVTAEGKTTVYVCEGNKCKYPTGDLEKVLKLVNEKNEFKL